MSTSQEEDMKPGVEGDQISLHVKSQDGQKVFFCIHRRTRLKKLMKAYCDYHYLDSDLTLFVFNGDRFHGEQTPHELRMEDEDEINAMFHQTDYQRAWINLKVTDQDGRKVDFRMHRRTQLKKLMKAYCDRKYLDFDSTVFLFHGARFSGQQTSDEVGMKDGDEINVMFHHTENQRAEINPKVEEELKEAVDLVDELNAEAETLSHLECLQLSQ
ncbi:Ubiquitin-like domain superfamily [Arabidopsis thaliana x Arabidopsis arenosa]|uniref:Ubiquitin-like domain superfamily n=1 Tax=Arabidopsis thaliana x Arabidopsis arenosa TaxID=1240361 RepID=A0A8T2AB45_9BRAS|nr:Ubiquitin-like domain superfamily [Arabidopsis thaliana x Arabidopsis arenosa]